MSLPNHYEILNVPSHATVGEIKAKYTALLLKYHPDKVQQQLGSTDMCNKVEGSPAAIATEETSSLLIHARQKFELVQEAWNILKDSEERKAYDSQLFAQKHELGKSHVYLETRLDDWECLTNADGKFYTHPCRCGGVYSVDYDEVTEEFSSQRRLKQVGEAAIGAGDGSATGTNATADGLDILVECDNCSFAILLRE